MSDWQDKLREYHAVAQSEVLEVMLGAGEIEEAIALCGSPIEESMLCALMTSRQFNQFWPCPHLQFEGKYEPSHFGFGSYIIPQLRVQRYRADFGVVWRFQDGLTCRLVVECDGHDFHEKTKQQAAYDKSRDRFLIGMGWPVLRFTGSEIYADALACADTVAEVLLETWVNLSRTKYGGS